MKRLLVICMVLIAALFAGCGNKVAQDEIIRYNNVELPELKKLEDAVLQSYGSVIGTNYTNDFVVFAELEENTVPLVRKLSEKAEAIDIKNEDLKNVHQIYIKYCRAMMNGMIAMQHAVETQDRSKVIDANKYMDESRDLGKEYAQKYQELCKKYNLTINK